uniref:Transmembrane 9 superfamily member n=1 Tax=Chromera velia CCMP2878 TaxID=1169474 RepID=A0A0G4H5F7_9ALVE|eukprot:Cvel_5727.t1-p1 / transcript=Cvel_5727.t1 / gene=Cvel_5727 / organism=Chromera_velia_CCMP2878 / gene_product=Transmembrane 9 superfamily member 4, putative / transcript_product=Transmembrane 9 superfamily member 4, putative / location=Cvel_scaffold271:65598-79386(-) / protein_length=635 / sequence_SO=supercontig / SO=protein_coding / is_pseudo=false
MRYRVAVKEPRGRETEVTFLGLKISRTGVRPEQSKTDQEYNPGDSVPLKVNKMTSPQTQIPYSFYHLDFCSPQKITRYSMHLGQILAGDALENSDYSLKMAENVKCRVLCDKPLTPEAAEKFQNFIDKQYVINWVVDDLPATAGDLSSASSEKQLFLIGTKDESTQRYFIHNFVTLQLQYHVTKQGTYRVVAVGVKPRSLDKADLTEDKCNTLTQAGGATGLAEVKAGETIRFAYEVEWSENTETTWASRWDRLRESSETIGTAQHWFHAINWGLIILFFSGFVATILLRSLKKDIDLYNKVGLQVEDISGEGDLMDEAGWKLVHADVFRKPVHCRVLSTLAGTGAQLSMMFLVLMVAAALGLVSPQHRGMVLQSMLVLFVVLALLNGYTAARLYKFFLGSDARKLIVMAALIFPGMAFGLFFCINAALISEGSSGAVSFSTLFTLLLLWFCISTPLVFMGAFAGFKQAMIEVPVRTNKIPRQIPEQPWYVRTYWLDLLMGIFPFGASSTEFYSAMSSIWHNNFYFLFGFALLVFILTALTCALISIFITYMILAHEEYRWWWRSFFASASSGLYFYAFSIYYASKLHVQSGVPSLIYFGYMGLMSYAFALSAGFFGLTASFAFVRYMYSAIKVD